MNIKTLEKVLPYALKAGITPWIWGFHGRGKTKFIENLCASFGWLCFNFRLGTQADVGDILGQTEIFKDANGLTYTKFHPPEWMAKAFEFCKANPDKYAVVFLDEINRVFRQDLIPPVFQMALDGRLHTHVFPPNLKIIVASNPPTKNYKVLKFDDKAFYDRFLHIKFSPSQDEWLKYISKEKWSPDIIGFLQEQPEFIENNDLEDFDLSDYIERGRRSWEFIEKLYRIDAPKDVIIELGVGIVEAKTVAAWVDYLNKGGKPLSPEDILKDYPSHRDKIIKYSSFTEQGRSDIVKLTCDNFVQFLQKDNPSDFTKKQQTNLLNFLSDIPGEILFDMCQPAGRFKAFIDTVNLDDALMDKINENKEAARLNAKRA